MKIVFICPIISRDAWGYGSVDPSSGTAVLMETVRVFGKMFKAGWRPRRTIGMYIRLFMLCSFILTSHLT